MRSLYALNQINADTIVVPSSARLVARLVTSSPRFNPSHLATPPPKFTIPQSNTTTVPIVPIQLAHVLEDITMSPEFTPLTFEFTQPNLPPATGRHLTTAVPLTSTRPVLAVAFWWDLTLHPTLPHVIFTHPASFQDHWPQCLYVFPDHEVVEGVEGEVVYVTAYHDDEKVSKDANIVHSSTINQICRCDCSRT